eukprot:7370277-Pyramimonas_sp.AAC.1
MAARSQSPLGRNKRRVAGVLARARRNTRQAALQLPAETLETVDEEDSEIERGREGPAEGGRVPTDSHGPSLASLGADSPRDAEGVRSV